MSLDNELQTALTNQGADFVYFVDVSQLTAEQNKRFPNAILMGIAFSPEYLRHLTTEFYSAQTTIQHHPIDKEEFRQKEARADHMADYTAHFLTTRGYSACSQSEDNLHLIGFYDDKRKRTPLPHKTIAGLAGIGWIGKHSLLVTPEFGSAVCISTVLTDAPLTTVVPAPVKSHCGNCTICKDICPLKAIKGNTWEIGTSRDELVDVFKCNQCLDCLVLCPWTQKFMNKHLIKPAE